MATVQERTDTSGADTSWSAAIEVAYQRRAVHLWEYGRRLGLDPGTAEDATQEVFARALHLVLGRRPGNLDAWLFRSLHNHAMDRHRKARRVQLVDLNEPSAGPDDARRLDLWQEVDHLPLRQRQAVYLRYRADLDFPAIASVLGITESGARANVFRAMATLRERVIQR